MVQERLLDIAIREFGAKGLEGASTRGIAAAAGTAMSSITYHYGGKEGLYLAAAEHIAAGMDAEFGAALATERQAAAGDPARAREAIHRLLARFLDKMASESSADWALFIVREQMNPTAAFDRLYGGAMGMMLATLVELICAASGARDRDSARVVAITLVGQVLALRASRASCLRLLERDAVDDNVLGAFRVRIDANTDAILDRLAAEQQGNA